MIKLNFPKFWLSNNLLSYCLIPLSWLYLLAGFVRKKIASPIHFPAYVICVGNVVVGGGGKTQIVAWLAQKLSKSYKVVIVTKAYRGKLKDACWVTLDSDAEMVGDESKLLANYGKVIAAKHIADIQKLVGEYQPDIMIFDDGMQNPNFHKDLTILAMSRGLGNQCIIPAGPLRQSLSSALEQSDMVIDISGDEKIKKELIGEDTPLFCANIVQERSLDDKKNYLAFAGIANPDGFFSLLEKIKANVKLKKSFQDHHHYSEEDINSLHELAKTHKLQLITTEKDYVKLSERMQNLEYLRIKLDFGAESEQRILSFVENRISQIIKG